MPYCVAPLSLRHERKHPAVLLGKSGGHLQALPVVPGNAIAAVVEPNAGRNGPPATWRGISGARRRANSCPSCDLGSSVSITPCCSALSFFAPSLRGIETRLQPLSACARRGCSDDPPQPALPPPAISDGLPSTRIVEALLKAIEMKFSHATFLGSLTKALLLMIATAGDGAVERMLMAPDQRLDPLVGAELHIGRTAPAQRGDERAQSARAAPDRRPSPPASAGLARSRSAPPDRARLQAANKILFIRQSGGQVRIYTELGKGTTMCLYLPRYVGAAQEEGVASEGTVTPGHGETVLVIDDEEVVRMLVLDVLEENRYAALEANDGPSGLRTSNPRRGSICSSPRSACPAG